MCHEVSINYDFDRAFRSVGWKGSGTTEEDLWLVLVISCGIVSLLMFEEGSSEHDRASYARKKNSEPWFLSVIQYNFHKLKHEVHLVLVLVAVGTDREWFLHINRSLKSSAWTWKGTFANTEMPGSEFYWISSNACPGGDLGALSGCKAKKSILLIYYTSFCLFLLHSAASFMWHILWVFKNTRFKIILASFQLYCRAAAGIQKCVSWLMKSNMFDQRTFIGLLCSFA